MRRVSRQLLSQGIYNIEVFLCLSLVCDVAADCDDDDVHPFFLVESLTKTRVLLFSSVKKHVSTPTFMPGDVTVCREYQHEACCTLDTVRKCVVVLFFCLLLLLLPPPFCGGGLRAQQQRGRAQSHGGWGASLFRSFFAFECSFVETDARACSFFRPFFLESQRR